MQRIALLALALGIAACSKDAPLAPRTLTPYGVMRQTNKGSGLTLDLTQNVTLPILGTTNLLQVNQAVLSNFGPLTIVGPIVGLDVTGVLSGTEVDALGNAIGTMSQPFKSEISVASSGSGQCSLVSLNLSNIQASALGVANVTIPATFNAKGSGAVGSLLCNLGQALSGIGSALGGGQGAQGLVNGLNNQIQ